MEDRFCNRCSRTESSCIKTVLALVSPYFEREFGAKRSNSSMKLTDRNTEDVKEFLRCIYPNIMSPVTLQNAEMILPLAHEFEVAQLKQTCEHVLIESISSDTDIDRIFELLQKAAAYGLDTLSELCLKVASSKPYREIIEASKKCDLMDSLKANVFEKCLISIYESAEGMVNTIAECHDHLYIDEYIGKTVELKVKNLDNYSVSHIVTATDRLALNITFFVSSAYTYRYIFPLSYNTLNMVITETRGTTGKMLTKVRWDNSPNKHDLFYVEDLNKEVEIASVRDTYEEFPDFEISVYLMVARPLFRELIRH